MQFKSRLEHPVMHKLIIGLIVLGAIFIGYDMSVSIELDRWNLFTLKDLLRTQGLYVVRPAEWLDFLLVLPMSIICFALAFLLFLFQW